MLFTSIFLMAFRWFRVNSGNTVAAGLAVASFGSLFVAPPVGLALGATSAACGVSSGAGDAAADSSKGRSLQRLWDVDVTEQLAFESVERELRCVLAKAAERQERLQNRQQAGTALAAYAQTACRGSQSKSESTHMERGTWCWCGRPSTWRSARPWSSAAHLISKGIIVNSIPLLIF